MADISPSNVDGDTKRARVLPRQIVLPFILVTSLFALWGFANDITNPMVAAFKNILLISNFESSLVQFAFYGGYCVMAIPAALFIKRFSYKTGILVGLALYAVGCLMFIPAGWMMAFWAFLISYFVMTCGLSFLETSSNPYILSMGPEETATQRLNFAQSFNPMGSIIGMFIAGQVILVSLNPTTEMGRRHIEGVAKGTIHHVQICDESLGLIENAQANLIEVNGRKLDTRTLTNTLDQVKSAQGRLMCLAVERGPQAVQLRTDLEEAEKQAPKLLDKAFGLLRTDPAAEAAQGVLDEQNEKLKAGFGGERARLDLTIQAFEEGKVLSTVAPGVVEEARPLVTAAATTLRTAQTQIASTIEALQQPSPSLELKAAAAEIGGLLSQSAETIKGANSKFQAIPAVDIADWYAKAGTQLHDIRQADLDVIIGPYTILGVVVLAALVLFVIAKLPRVSGEEDDKLNIAATFGRLARNRKYIEGVVAQAFYVGAQIMCWTFIIQYGVNELGMEKASVVNHNIVAMVVFVSSRFICTALLKFFSPGGLLMALALGGLGLVSGAIFIKGMTGLYCLMGVSACMSLMFPTIYGIALKGLGDDAKLGAAGLIMAIGGGCLMPPMQGAIMDMDAFNLGFMTLSSTRMSFMLPLICFVVIAIFGFRTSKVHGHKY